MKNFFKTYPDLSQSIPFNPYIILIFVDRCSGTLRSGMSGMVGTRMSGIFILEYASWH